MKTFWKLIFKDIGNDSDELFVELSFSRSLHLASAALDSCIRAFPGSADM